MIILNTIDFFHSSEAYQLFTDINNIWWDNTIVIENFNFPIDSPLDFHRAIIHAYRNDEKTFTIIIRDATDEELTFFKLKYL